MFGYSFVWRTWALTTYSLTKVDGPGRWVCFETIYWEWRDGKKVYYADEAMKSSAPDKYTGE
jgi:hypothetical protein